MQHLHVHLCFLERKHATDGVEAFKAIKKLCKPGELEQLRKRNRVSITTPKLITQTVTGVGTKAASGRATLIQNITRPLLPKIEQISTENLNFVNVCKEFTK